MPVIVVTRLRLKDRALLDEFFTAAVALAAVRAQGAGIRTPTCPQSSRSRAKATGAPPV